MNTLRGADTYYEDPSRSPPQPTQQRSQSRFMDNYNNPQGMYAVDDLPPQYEAQRMLPGMQGGYSGYEFGMPAWNSTSYGHNNPLATAGVTLRGKPSRGRHAPEVSLNIFGITKLTRQPWLNQGSPFSMGNQSMMPSIRADASHDDDDLIPTAIVIKNIPFAVKKEQLIQLMTDLRLPIPYAFNYHFDNGVFRGLAFANFTTPEETQIVINTMNHMELQGRKLRVEYKKMLPQAERERIEREKRERRGQLEEQHRPIPTSQLQNQPSLSSLSSHLPGTSPSPLSARAAQSAGGELQASSPASAHIAGYDMNDPMVLGYYSRLIVWQGDSGQDEVLTFPPNLPPEHRTLIHGLAHNLGLGHESFGSGEERRIQVFRLPQGRNAGEQGANLDPNRRGLYRAATTDFSDVREPANYAPVKQNSGLLNLPEQSLASAANLRSAKSHADLRSWSPSPAQSASSFPTGLANNASRYQEFGQNSPGSSRSNVTPTTTTMNSEALLVNGMGNMNIGQGFGAAHSPHKLRGMMSWEREAPGPIGGHRTFSATLEDRRNSRPHRAPLPDRSAGYSRARPNGHQARGSDELSTPGVEPTTEQTQ